MENKKRIALTLEEWENLSEEEKNKPFSHPRWHQVPAVSEVIEPKEMSEELKELRRKNEEMLRKHLAKLGLLPNDDKQD